MAMEKILRLDAPRNSARSAGKRPMSSRAPSYSMFTTHGNGDLIPVKMLITGVFRGGKHGMVTYPLKSQFFLGSVQKIFSVLHHHIFFVAETSRSCARLFQWPWPGTD